MKQKPIFLSLAIFAAIALTTVQKIFAADISVNLKYPLNGEKCVPNNQKISIEWEIINPNNNDGLDGYDGLFINVWDINSELEANIISSFVLPLDAESYEFNDEELEMLRSKLYSDYYWRVIIFSENSEDTDPIFSRTFSFQLTQAPEFSTVSIEDNATCVSLKPKLHWSNKNHFAKNCFAQVSYSENFDSPDDENIVIIPLNDSSAMVTINETSNLDGNTTFYWRVIHTACPNNHSETRAFTTTVNSPITLVSPENNAVGETILPVTDIVKNTIRLDWENSTQTYGNIYHIQITTDIDFDDEYLIVVDDSVMVEYYDFDFDVNYNQRYRWRVLLVDENETCNSWSDIHSFTTPFRAITPISPTVENNECFPLDATFIWERRNFRVHYQICISTDSLFPEDDEKTFYYNTSTIDTNSIVIPLPNENTEYFWKIRAFNLIHDTVIFNTSVWSKVLSFRTNLRGPQLLTPVNENMNVAANSTIELSWEMIADILCNYEIQIASTPDFDANSMIKRTVEGNIDTYNFALSNNVEDYYWRVKAHPINDEEYCSSDWSETFMFSMRIGAPTIISPGVAYPSDTIDAILTTSTTLKWTKPENAKRYDIECSLSMDALNNNDYDNMRYKHNYGEDSLLVDYLEADTIYYWRVRAKNDNSTSNWSKTFYFRTGFHEPLSVILSSPANNSTFAPSNVELRWRQNVLAQRFEIIIDTVDNFSSGKFKTIITDTNDTYYIFGETEFTTKYYWRVRAINENVTGPWSPIWNFTTAPPAPFDAVVLIAPENDIDGISPDKATFIWNALNTAQYYILQLSKVENFNTTVFNQNISNRTSYILDRLENETIYYWRILAGNVNGDGSEWSEVRKFKTGISSIIDLSYTSFINIAPNPVNVSTSYCNIGLTKSANLTVLIFDALGNEVESINIDCLEGKNSIVLNTNQLSIGNYLCKVIADGKIIATTQFVVIK